MSWKMLQHSKSWEKLQNLVIILGGFVTMNTPFHTAYENIDLSQ